jgi:hypothetical protein
MRQALINRLAEAFEPRPEALAFWQGGSAAFGRGDEMSDLDLQLLVKDEFVEPARGLLEQTIRRAAPIEASYILPQPTWHGYWQGFYRLQGAGPYMLIDAVIMKESDQSLLTEPEIHGQAVVYFDRSGRVGRERADREKLRTAIGTRLGRARASAEIFHCFVDKELNRGRQLDALALYQSLVLAPLVETLRIIHDPFRFNFGSRYLDFCLSAEEIQELKSLSFVGSAGELIVKKEFALGWLKRNLEAIDPDRLFNAKNNGSVRQK